MPFSVELAGPPTPQFGAKTMSANPTAAERVTEFSQYRQRKQSSNELGES